MTRRVPCVGARVLLLASVLGGCVITRESDAASDSTTTVVVALDTMPPPTRAPSTASADTGLRAPLPSPPPSITPRIDLDTAVSGGDIEPALSAVPGAAPSARELDALSEELAMPLPGVTPEELRDTFNEARGGGTRIHQALDIMAPRGTPVLSAAPGRVLKLHTSNAGGLMVYAADSAERFVLMYAHLDGYADGLRDGLPLRRGQVLGYVGTTGNAAPDAPHLHFAIAYPQDVNLWWTGQPVDPRPLLQRKRGAH